MLNIFNVNKTFLCSMYNKGDFQLHSKTLPLSSPGDIHWLSFSTSLSSPSPAEKGLFILQSQPLKSCISVQGSELVLKECGRPTASMLWKWVSQHRLFNLGTSMCLGLDVANTTQPLGMFECDVAIPVMWWRCRRNSLFGASQWKLATAGQLVVVKKNSYHEWIRYDTNQEGPCSYPYEGESPKQPAPTNRHNLKYF